VGVLVALQDPERKVPAEQSAEVVHGWHEPAPTVDLKKPLLHALQVGGTVEAGLQALERAEPAAQLVRQAEQPVS